MKLFSRFPVAVAVAAGLASQEACIHSHAAYAVNHPSLAPLDLGKPQDYRFVSPSSKPGGYVLRNEGVTATVSREGNIARVDFSSGGRLVSYVHEGTGFKVIVDGRAVKGTTPASLHVSGVALDLLDKKAHRPSDPRPETSQAAAKHQ